MPNPTGNPQLEDGFARIANEILDVIARTPLSDYENRCIHFLWRKTYGWADKKGVSKKVDAIAYSQWSDGTGIQRRRVFRVLQGLVLRNIITKHIIKPPGKNAITVWGFQKRYTEWAGYVSKVVPSQSPLPDEPVALQTLLPLEVVPSQSLDSVQVVSKQEKVSTEKAIEVSSQQSHTIDNKDNIQKTPSLSKLHFDLAEKLKGLILKNKPNSRVPKNLGGWAKDFDLMLRVDGRTEEEINAVMEFSQRDPFWLTVIRSAGNLRAKFDQLELKMPGGKKYFKVVRTIDKEALGEII